jgi:type VI secretion system protein ImpA
MAASAGGDLKEESAAAEASDVPATNGSMAPRGGGGVGGISGPGDVINALDRIMDYYARQEPSSPIPILLARAKRLVNADFMTIVKDMAPSGVDNVSLIGGLSDEAY